MWMVRAGEGDFLIDDFKEGGFVAIEGDTGDLSNKNIDELKKIISDSYVQTNNLSQFKNFIHDFEIGDFVISLDHLNEFYIVGRIVSDYYYSEKLLKKYGNKCIYFHFHDVEWIGKTKVSDLKNDSKDILKSSNVFKIAYNGKFKKNLLEMLNNDKIEWIDFYKEFANVLLGYKDNRLVLIDKIKKIYNDIDKDLPKLTDNINPIPNDIDPFTI